MGTGRVQEGYRRGRGGVQEGYRRGTGRVQEGYRKGTGRIQRGYNIMAVVVVVVEGFLLLCFVTIPPSIPIKEVQRCLQFSLFIVCSNHNVQQLQSFRSKRIWKF